MGWSAHDRAGSRLLSFGLFEMWVRGGAMSQRSSKTSAKNRFGNEVSCLRQIALPREPNYPRTDTRPVVYSPQPVRAPRAPVPGSRSQQPKAVQVVAQPHDPGPLLGQGLKVTVSHPLDHGGGHPGQLVGGLEVGLGPVGGRAGSRCGLDPLELPDQPAVLGNVDQTPVLALGPFLDDAIGQPSQLGGCLGNRARHLFG